MTAGKHRGLCTLAAAACVWGQTPDKCIQRGYMTLLLGVSDEEEAMKIQNSHATGISQKQESFWMSLGDAFQSQKLII